MNPYGKTEAEKKLVRQIRKEAPTCAGCGRKLSPHYKRESERIEDGNGFWTVNRIVGVYWYGCGQDQLFCTLKCAYAYAVRCARRLK